MYGDKRMSRQKIIESILRVNHAGELGARQIYKAQSRFLGDDPDLLHMAAQEEEHLKIFSKLMIENKVRPTLLQPLWHVLSYGMGAATALMGKRAAHACTIAVEEVIVEHYQKQIDSLEDKPEYIKLMDSIKNFKDQEEEHKIIAENGKGREAKHYKTIENTVKTITKLAIKISERI